MGRRARGEEAPQWPNGMDGGDFKKSLDGSIAVLLTVVMPFPFNRLLRALRLSSAGNGPSVLAMPARAAPSGAAGDDDRETNLAASVQCVGGGLDSTRLDSRSPSPQMPQSPFYNGRHPSSRPGPLSSARRRSTWSARWRRWRWRTALGWSRRSELGRVLCPSFDVCVRHVCMHRAWIHLSLALLMCPESAATSPAASPPSTTPTAWRPQPWRCRRRRLMAAIPSTRCGACGRPVQVVVLRSRLSSKQLTCMPHPPLLFHHSFIDHLS